MAADQTSGSKTSLEPEKPAELPNETIVCPLCGAVTVQEKCKIICRSEICRGRVVMNCSEF